jgi:hypothetical protein
MPSSHPSPQPSVQPWHIYCGNVIVLNLRCVTAAKIVSSAVLIAPSGGSASNDGQQWRLRVKAIGLGGSWANITGHASGRFLTVYSRFVQES